MNTMCYHPSRHIIRFDYDKEIVFFNTSQLYGFDGQNKNYGQKIIPTNTDVKIRPYCVVAFFSKSI